MSLEKICQILKLILEIYSSNNSSSEFVYINEKLSSLKKIPSEANTSKESGQSTSDSCEIVEENPRDFNSIFSRRKLPKKSLMAKGDKEVEMEYNFGSHIKKTEFRKIPSLKIVEEIAKEEIIQIEEILPCVEYKYYFKNYDKPLMNVNDSMGTDDEDLFLFSDYVNDPMTSKQWEKVDESKVVTIFKKTIPGSEVILTKTISTLNYDKNTIFKAICDIQARKSWDEVLNKYYIVEGNEEKAIIYTKVNGITLVLSERETVQQRKVWRGFPDNDSICVHYKSVEHKDVPIKSSVVRAEVIIAGYYLKTLSPNRTLFVTFDQFDFKGNVPKFVINKFSTSVPKEWISNLANACKKLSQTM